MGRGGFHASETERKDAATQTPLFSAAVIFTDTRDGRLRYTALLIC